MSEAAQRPNAQIGQLAGDEDERLALAAAMAIQRLLADRNAVRSYAAAQERELTRLRRHIALTAIATEGSHPSSLHNCSTSTAR